MPSSKDQATRAPLVKTNGTPERNGTIAHPAITLGKFHDAIKTLRNEDNFREVLNVHEHLEHLQQALQSKDEQIRNLQEETEKQKGKEHEAIERLLTTYHSVTSTHDVDVQTLKSRIANLEASGKEKDSKFQSLENEKSRIEKEHGKSEASLQQALFALGDADKKFQAIEKKYKDGKLANSNMNKSLEQERGKVGRLQGDLLSVKRAFANTTNDLDLTRKQLQEIESMRVPLQEEKLETTVLRLKSLRKSAFDFVHRHFHVNLPESSLNDDALWGRLGALDQKVPLPRSNSSAAKDIRCAIILAYLFRIINECIFQPNYLNILGQSRHVLRKQAQQDSHKEAYCRSLLLSVLPDEQDAVAKKLAKNVVRICLKFVNGLSRADQDEKVKRELAELIEASREAWSTIRRLKPCYEPSMDYSHDVNDDWQMLKFDGSKDGIAAETHEANNPNNKALLVVFPGLFIAEESNTSQGNADPRAVMPGTVLRKSQTVAAEQEVSEGEKASPTRWRTPLSFGRRRDSTATNLLSEDALSDSLLM